MTIEDQVYRAAVEMEVRTLRKGAARHVWLSELDYARAQREADAEHRILNVHHIYHAGRYIPEGFAALMDATLNVTTILRLES